MRHIGISSRFVVYVLLCLFVFGIISTPVNALSPAEEKTLQLDTVWYKSGHLRACESSISSSRSNVDYRGNEILNPTQLANLTENASTYQEAADKVDIPWQMLAVVHLREHGLKKSNPSNGQGIYQFYSKQGGPYPTGKVSDAEFLRQTILAAEFLKTKAGSNYAQNKNLTAQSPPEVIKDTFFGYNGRAQVYVDQAKSIGFGGVAEGYEGSPYVMNKADAKRDPDVAKSGTWGQIKTDGGSIQYPANDDYGAFVVYASIAGITINDGCDTTSLSGPVRDKIVTAARKELALWNSGSMKPGNDYKKYSFGLAGDWCAWFASWLYIQAEYPLTQDNKGSIGSTRAIRAVGEKNELFTYNPAGGDYIPLPGDLVIQDGHVNVVVAVKDTKITVIGGNQGGTSGFTTSKVTEYTMAINDSKNLGFVSPNIQEDN